MLGKVKEDMLVKGLDHYVIHLQEMPVFEVYGGYENMAIKFIRIAVDSVYGLMIAKEPADGIGEGACIESIVQI